VVSSSCFAYFKRKKIHVAFLASKKYMDIKIMQVKRQGRTIEEKARTIL
jgi:hypothetical protein